MALPAGRYGVTKNQLLKIKKLPMNTIKLIEELTEKFNLLGTAAFKNSTSVVTESSDLVESGAVKDIVGWGNKNLLNPDVIKNTALQYVPVYVGDGEFTLSSTCPQTGGALACIFLLAGSERTGASTSDNGVWNGQTRTVTAVDGYVTVASRNEDGVNPTLYHNQLEKGSTATAYEPYHASVEESKADNSVIGTVENGTTIQKSDGYAVGTHAIRNGAFITWKNAKAQGETINDASDYTSGDVADELDIKSGTLSDFNANITRLHQSEEGCFKYGNIAEIICFFRVDSAMSGVNTLFRTPFASKSNGSFCVPIGQILSGDAPFDSVGVSFYITSYNEVKINGNLPVGDYVISTIYICQ